MVSSECIPQLEILKFLPSSIIFVYIFFEYDFIGSRNYNNFIHYLGGVLSVAFTIAGIGTNIGHELTHRTNKKIDVTFGRWMFSMSCNADFSIEHVYGHHVNVCTDKDPASARRGENVYSFFLRSTIFPILCKICMPSCRKSAAFE